MGDDHDGMKLLMDYVHSVSSALFGVTPEEVKSLIVTGEETSYALSKFATDSDVMALYVEWLRTDTGTGEYCTTVHVIHSQIS